MESDRERPLVSIPGRAAGPLDHSPGCPFAPRCPAASDRCRDELPELTPLASGHRGACWHPNSVVPQQGPARRDESMREDALA
jgi:oligopeptide/dipeptide ABC transporter ATP-binding protein